MLRKRIIFSNKKLSDYKFWVITWKKYTKPHNTLKFLISQNKTLSSSVILSSKTILRFSLIEEKYIWTIFIRLQLFNILTQLLFITSYDSQKRVV